MTRETNEELLFMILFFGFLLFNPSFTGGAARAGLPSPNKDAAPVPSTEGVGVLSRLPMLTSESLTPDVGGAGTVASGLGFMTGASEGCGGGVAKCRSSRRR